MLVRFYTCQNVKLLEISYHGLFGTRKQCTNMIRVVRLSSCLYYDVAVLL